MTMLSVRREVGEFRKRYKWMALVAVVAFGSVLLRLVQLQVFEHPRWAAEARDNITRRVRLPAIRGIVRDRAGLVVATNRPSYEVFATPQLLDEGDVKLIARLMGLDEPRRLELVERLAAVPPHRRSHLIEIFSDVTREQYAAIEMHKRDLPGVEALVVPVRSYPFGALGAHALGFLNEVTADDLSRHPERGYRAGQRIGRGGVERAWEPYLRGREGQLRVIVDVRGQEQHGGPHRLERNELRREPIPGRDLRLTLDMNMMHSIERAFRGHPSGAAVVVDARTGRVRALFSKPAYDLNEMSGGLSVARRREIEDDPFRPLIDKTLYESYSPGSTFKPFGALAALDDGTLTPAVRNDCPGYYELGRRRFRCSHIHGNIDLRAAIVQSCNVYFYRLAEQIGLDRLAAISREFGFGAVSGLGINTEAAGFIPTRDWYKKRHGDRYRVGFTLNEVIGQGNTKVTLMQLAMAYAAIANGGTLYVPQIVQAVEGPDGSVIEEFGPRVRRRVELQPEHLAHVIDAMYGVVNDPNGTAFDEKAQGGVPVAGKTGTAQVAKRSLPPGEDPKRAWYYRRSHAWFAGFAPADAPELVIVVLVEHGGHGGKFAAPLGVQILQEALGATTRAVRAAPPAPDKPGARATARARREAHR